MVAFGVVGLTHLSKSFLEVFARQPSFDLAGLFDTDPKQSQLAAKASRTISYREPAALFQFSEAVILGEESDNTFALAKEALTHFQHLFICLPSSLSEEEMSALLKISEESQVLVRFGGSIMHHPVSEALAAKSSHPFFVEIHHSLHEEPKSAIRSKLINLMTADLSFLLSLTEGMVCKAETSVPGNVAGSGALECRLRIDNGAEIRMVYSFGSPTPQRVVTLQQPGATLIADYHAGTLTSGPTIETLASNPFQCTLRQLDAFARDIENHESELIDRDILMFFLAHALVNKAKPWLLVNCPIRFEV